jgi:hypothetical protein
MMLNAVLNLNKLVYLTHGSRSYGLCQINKLTCLAAGSIGQQRKSPPTSQVLHSSSCTTIRTFCPKNSILFNTRACSVSHLTMAKLYSTAINNKHQDGKSKENEKNETKEEKKEPAKKTSKFKQFYSQYGPLFLVVHLTTVVMWIYGFFLISKQYVLCSKRLPHKTSQYLRSMA